MAAQNSRLPPEIISSIIDHLHDDKQSLNACSLVCKAWTYPARVHRFSRLVLELKWPIQQWHLAVFPYVRHLRLRHYQLSDATCDGFIPLLVGFYHVVSLELDLASNFLDAVNPQWWSTLGRNFSAVVSLSLTFIKFSNASSIAQVFCAFPCLRKLYIGFGIFTETTSTELASATAFRLPPNLHTFELSLMDINRILEWFLSLPIHPAFRTICLYDIEAEELAMFHRFIEALGNGLESLSLSTNIFTEVLLDISPLTRLRSIEFLVDVDAEQDLWVTQTLSHISSACLEDVTFRLDVCESDNVANTNALDWTNVDAVLQHSTFSRVRNVCFPYLPSSAPPSFIMQHLPQCNARGILRFDS